MFALTMPVLLTIFNKGAQNSAYFIDIEEKYSRLTGKKIKRTLQMRTQGRQTHGSH
jgi:hypothetical protein